MLDLSERRIERDRAHPACANEEHLDDSEFVFEISLLPSEIVQRIIYVELRWSTVVRLTYYVAFMLLFASPCELTTKLSQDWCHLQYCFAFLARFSARSAQTWSF